MASKGEHVGLGLAVGGLVGAGLYLWNRSRREERADGLELLLASLGGAALGGLAALGPDALEPALHPGHRAFFHSLAFAGTMGYGTYKLMQREEVPTAAKAIALVIAAGYGSHLAADAFTPKGLPLIGLK